MSYLAEVDEAACAAHGDCVDAAPTVFALTDDVAEVIGTGSDETLMAAAEACPSAAIRLYDANSGDQVYP